MMSICTLTRVSVAGMLALMVAVSCAPTETAETTPATPADTPIRPALLLDDTEPFDATEQAGRSRFATQISNARFAPDWLGETLLSVRQVNANGQYDTPVALLDRRFITETFLPPSPDNTFTSQISDVPDDVLARSTWHDGCPITTDELAYVQVSFYGFDGVTHTGEILIHQDHATDIVGVFQQLHAARFPLEALRVISQEELDREATGDGNVSTGFVCRSVVSGASWSEHAYGRAIDINPFHNPYLRGTKVIPELATTYLDRSNVRSGMIVDSDVVVEAFATIGWPWGGNWVSAKDWMHFSSTGR